MNAVRAILISAFATAAIGCPKADQAKRIEIYALTAPPPARAAQITNGDAAHRVVIGKGVALAVTSWTTCPGSPDTALSSADPTTLGTRTVYRRGMPDQFLIFGVRAGFTTLTAKNGCAEQRYDVEVRAD
ncbi:MAG: hypothetical protein HYV09_00750 [Deltaproteobacteria bacterium]|nr:hypothetical protein [Deltaproteobacteria bacterium]